MVSTNRLLLIALGVGAALLSPGLPGSAKAASSAGCEGGGFSVAGAAFLVNTDGTHTIAASKLGAPFRLRVTGKFNEFLIVPDTFEVENWLFTGAANPLDITGGRRTLVWERKTPDHRGLVLNGDVIVERSGDDIVVQRTGPGLTMKIQAKDCANGGIFQMEVERKDGTTTRVTHVLADGIFYFDNPNFRAGEGDVVPFKLTTIVVPSRINIANDVSAKFVGRDSPQVATRLQEPSCSNQIRKRDLTFVTVQHCGRVSRWDVASGGRMGWVTGEDATEVAPPATNCVKQCQAQNRVRGQSVVLGFPFPVPDASRLKPPFPSTPGS